MKTFITTIILSLTSTISYASSATQLVCHSVTNQTIKADMSGYTLSKIQVKSGNKNWSHNNIISGTDSYDMFKSQKFEPTFSYPVYSLGTVEGCSYILALPGGDMRNDQFTGLLFVGGKCAQNEIELDCSTNTL